MTNSIENISQTFTKPFMELVMGTTKIKSSAYEKAPEKRLHQYSSQIHQFDHYFYHNSVRNILTVLSCFFWQMM